ncbi:MAG: peptidoglycan DD-metalloendopeptidase family protein [Rickettsiales bacterium]|nr:peptidoglycan DD-metalloendopeptidase family protein [Rickettsiales bacterium]
MLFIPLAAGAQTAKNLEKINKAIVEKKREQEKLAQESNRIAKEIREVQDKLVSTTRNIKSYEGRISEFDRQLANMNMKERELREKADASGENLARILAAFESIALVPTGYAFMREASAEGIFKSSALLKALTMALSDARVAYSSDLSALAELKDSILRAKLEIVSLNTKVKGEKSKIQGLIKAKQSSSRVLESRNKKASAEIAKLVKESKTIEEFLKREAALRAKRTVVPSGEPRRFTGRVSLPVSGFISAYFGDKIKSGVVSKGLYIKPKQGASIVSPTDAEVVFAGSFYGYKNLLILHSLDNYYIIMGGLGSTYAGEGQNLLAGEPVGEAGGEFYLEIREGEKVINPTKYFKI